MTHWLIKPANKVSVEHICKNPDCQRIFYSSPQNIGKYCKRKCQSVMTGKLTRARKSGLKGKTVMNQVSNEQIVELAELTKQMVHIVNDLQNSHQRLLERIEMQGAQLKELRGRIESLEQKSKAEAA